jgi:hypothetical protein
MQVLTAKPDGGCGEYDDDIDWDEIDALVEEHTTAAPAPAPQQQQQQQLSAGMYPAAAAAAAAAGKAEVPAVPAVSCSARTALDVLRQEQQQNHHHQQQQQQHIMLRPDQDQSAGISSMRLSQAGCWMDGDADSDFAAAGAAAGGADDGEDDSLLITGLFDEAEQQLQVQQQQQHWQGAGSWRGGATWQQQQQGGAKAWQQHQGLASSWQQQQQQQQAGVLGWQQGPAQPLQQQQQQPGAPRQQQQQLAPAADWGDTEDMQLQEPDVDEAVDPAAAAPAAGAAGVSVLSQIMKEFDGLDWDELDMVMVEDEPAAAAAGEAAGGEGDAAAAAAVAEAATGAGVLQQLLCGLGGGDALGLSWDDLDGLDVVMADAEVDEGGNGNAAESAHHEDDSAAAAAEGGGHVVLGTDQQQGHDAAGATAGLHPGSSSRGVSRQGLGMLNARGRTPAAALASMEPEQRRAWVAAAQQRQQRLYGRFIRLALQRQLQAAGAGSWGFQQLMLLVGQCLREVVAERQTAAAGSADTANGAASRGRGTRKSDVDKPAAAGGGAGGGGGSIGGGFDIMGFIKRVQQKHRELVLRQQRGAAGSSKRHQAAAAGDAAGPGGAESGACDGDGTDSGPPAAAGVAPQRLFVALLNVAHQNNMAVQANDEPEPAAAAGGAAAAAAAAEQQVGATAVAWVPSSKINLGSCAGVS